MNLTKLQVECKKWQEYNFPDGESFEPLLGIVEEVGELSHAYLKRRQAIRGSYYELTCKIADSVGDIIVFLADFCNRNNFYLEKCVDYAWQEASKRDWILYPKDGLTK